MGEKRTSTKIGGLIEFAGLLVVRLESVTRCHGEPPQATFRGEPLEGDSPSPVATIAEGEAFNFGAGCSIRVDEIKEGGRVYFTAESGAHISVRNRDDTEAD